MKPFKHKLLLFVFCFGSFHILLAQYDIPEKPSTQTSVYDYYKLLSPSEKTQLENKLIKYSDTTSTQIVVAIIATTKGEDIGILTPRWAHKWGIGQEKEDNGVFILLARDDRKIWISPGYGVEHKLTAGMVGEVVRYVIIPEFKRNNYYKGLDKGSDAIFKILEGEYQGTRKQSGNGEFPVGVIIFLIFIFIVILIAISKNKRDGGNRGNRRRRSQGSDILEAIILSNMGRGGYRRSSGGGIFGGGNSSGGGFGGGFGGGGFSGGGAGGSW